MKDTHVCLYILKEVHDDLYELSEEGRIILKWMSKKEGVKMWTELVWLSKQFSCASCLVVLIASKF
jgi:hypothetical protein